MSMFTMIAATQAAAEEGFTWGDVLESFPTDPLSIFTMLLLLTSIGAVLYFGTRTGRSRTRPPEQSGDEKESTPFRPVQRGNPPRSRHRAS